MISNIIEQIRKRGGIRGLLRHSMVKNTLLLYSVQFSSYLIPLLTTPYLARVLHPEKQGLVFFAQSFIWYFITLSDYGFALTATRKIAVHGEEPEQVSRIFSSVMTAKLLLGAVGFVLMELVVLSVPRLRSEMLLYTVTYLNVIGNVLFPVWYFQGLQRLEQVAIRDFVAKMSGLVLLFLMVHDESDYILAAGIQSGAMVIAALGGMNQIRKVMPIRWIGPSVADLIAEFKEGWPVFLSMAALGLTATTNTFILGLWASEAQVGYYSAAYRLVVTFRSMVIPLVSVIYPYLSSIGSSDKERVVRFLRREGLLIPVPFLLISLFMLFSAPWLVPLVFGEDYMPSIVLLQILSFSPFLLALSHNYSTYYMLAFGYDGQWSRLVLWGTALNFVVLFPLLAFLPPEQAVAATLIAVDLYSVMAAFWFFERTRKTQ